nr:protein suppressor of k(+) transport growth defect 1 [Quercus suber]
MQTNNPQQQGNPTEESQGSSYFEKLSNVKLDDVGGLQDCKRVLMEAAIWPRKYPQFFTGNRKPWRTVLLFGPPGTGKTLLAKAIAAEAKFYFCSISPSNIVSKLMGESERHVKDLFKEACKKVPSIIFIDEIDSLCGPRGENNEHEAARRIKSELLVHMQDVSDAVEHVLILAATNTPYALDQALRRRFDMRIYIPLPDYKARERIFEVQIGKTPSMIDKNGLESLAKGTKGFSGADISSYVKDALYHSIRATLREKFFIKTEDNVWVPCQDAGVSDKKSLRELEKLKQNSKIQVPKITLDDFKKVSKRHKRTVNEADLNLLEKFDNEFGAR